MKTYIFILISLFVFFNASAQSDSLKIDSLKKVLQTQKEDTNKVKTSNLLAEYYFSENLYNKTIEIENKNIALAEKIGDKKDVTLSYHLLALSYNLLADTLEAKRDFESELKIYRELKDTTGIATSIIFLSQFPWNAGNHAEGLRLMDEGLDLARKFKPAKDLIGYAYYFKAQAATEVVDSLKKSGNNKLVAKEAKKGIEYFDSVLSYMPFNEEVALNIGTLYKNAGLFDSAKRYFEKGLQLAEEVNNRKDLYQNMQNLSEIYSMQGNYEKAYKFYKHSKIIEDSVSGNEEQKKALQQKLQFENDKKEAIVKAEQDKKDAEEKLRRYQSFFILLGVASVALILFVSNRKKQKANLLLQNEKQKVESTLQELKSTQAQLILSEKMASLGELTAGIAHEIQNPLNFVNNFSEVNKEMLEELKAERLKPKAERDEQEQDEIINDVIENEEKINHHGKRADAIVKNMLQHSRQTKGVKEPTDINALCDEYLRLSYHGLRAKDKSFNADFKTDFDQSIGKINIVPQDIGRVLLNLFNNAFYAVNEKHKAESLTQKADYKPFVLVQTNKVNGKVEIKVSDNGNGISQKIIDKIFQPFFTTKPTGQGTGLGLSLAYDIITKEHNGTITVESKEEEGSVFIIQLPL